MICGGSGGVRRRETLALGLEVVEGWSPGMELRMLRVCSEGASSSGLEFLDEVVEVRSIESELRG